MLTAKEVSERLNVPLRYVYANKKLFGGVQFVPNGKVMFSEDAISTIEKGDLYALEGTCGEMGCKQDDQWGQEFKSLRNKERSRELGSSAGQKAQKELHDRHNLLY